MKAKDGWIYVAAGSNDAWNTLLKLMGREDMIGNPQFNTNAKRRLRKEFLEGMIADWMKTKNRDELIELFKTTWSGPTRANILAAPIREVDELPDDPHGRARGTIIDVEHPTAGKVTIVGSILKMSETPGTVEWLGMPLGHHNEEVYGKLLGYSKEQIANLEKEGVI
jgi:crotonobetainyl-CoA:carnitine CoA-transferase CaiB-like acyl-CoA transferase